MLKVKNFLMLGLLTMALALFVPACSESEQEEDNNGNDSTGYAISINGGTMEWWEDPTDPTSTSPLKNGDTLYLNDVVIILSAEPEEGQVFVRWDVTPASAAGRFNDRTNPRTTFQMPASNVTITAIFGDDDVGEPDGYTISTIGGDMLMLGTLEEFMAMNDLTEEELVELLSSLDPLNNGSILYEDDVVLVLSADPPAGKVFVRWEVTPASAAENLQLDPEEPVNVFIMPNSNVVITAVFGEEGDEDFFDGNAEVRFTWEASEAANIEHISVNDVDVAWWKDAVWDDLANAREDFSAVPLYDGNPSLPSFAKPYVASTGNKGKYYPTDAGSFTAVCGIEDPLGLAEIVANYTITIDPATATADGADKFFEIAFAVGDFIAGEDELGWFDDEYDNPNTDPRLEKKAASKVSIKRVATKQYKKPGATLDVTFYVIRRPAI